MRATLQCYNDSEISSLQSNFERQSFTLLSGQAKGSGWENRLKAERAWFLTDEVRRAKPETEQLLSDLWPALQTQISGSSKGVCPLGRRAGVKVLPEKGRQRAVSGVRRALEGGKRSCSPSKVLVGAKVACFRNPLARAFSNSPRTR